MYNFNKVGKGVYIWQPAAIESGNPYGILSAFANGRRAIGGA